MPIPVEMTRSIFFLVIMAALGTFLAESECWAKVIHVPSEQPSIQAGINTASNGDTVEVSPGTYFENINFKGKLITVTSTAGPKVTTINGRGANAVVIFSSGETTAAVLSGFTVTNGSASGEIVAVEGGDYPCESHRGGNPRDQAGGNRRL
jgi:hypothetical protein